MKATTEITRKDLAFLSIYLFPRVKANWIFLGVLIAAIAIFLALSKRPSDISGFISVAISSVLGGIGGTIIGFAINIVTMLLSVGSKSGILGLHQYELCQEGVRESTEANESLQRWSSISSIKVCGNYMLLRICSNQFHIIPKRSFESEALFMSFYKEAMRLKNAA